MKTALITGVCGQDGAYLSQLLLEKGYKVVGGYRRTTTPSFWRLERLGIKDDVELVPFELMDNACITLTIAKYMPDEIYNFAAQSFVPVSFQQAAYVGDINGLAVTRILEAIRVIDNSIKFYQASTSEMFGQHYDDDDETLPCDEGTPFHPRSPYAIAKLYGHWITVNYREAYGMFAVSGILFNHESSLRGSDFVTKRIVEGLADVKRGNKRTFTLGNVDAERDWGFAGDYVRGIWLMLQNDVPDNFVLATGHSTSVRDFATLAAATAGFRLEWTKDGAVDQNGNTIIKLDPELCRLTDVNSLCGDARKAKRKLNWAPTLDTEGLAVLMMEAELG